MAGQLKNDPKIGEFLQKRLRRSSSEFKDDDSLFSAVFSAFSKDAISQADWNEFEALRTAAFEKSQREAISKLSPRSRAKVSRLLNETGGSVQTGDGPELAPEPGESDAAFEKRLDDMLAARLEKLAGHGETKDHTPSRDNDMSGNPDLLGMGLAAAGGGFGQSAPRVKSVAEMYQKTRPTLRHRKAAQDPSFDRPVLYQGQPVEGLSPLEQALTGAWVKARFGRRLNEHETQLIDYLAAEEQFVVGDGDEAKLAKFGSSKALLDDSTSGGADSVPLFVDRLPVTMPLVNGELFPFCDIRNPAKGSSFRATYVHSVSLVEGAGSAEGTAINLFDTTDMIDKVEGDFHVVAVALMMGLDFLEDSAIDVGQTVQNLIAEKFSQRFDYYVTHGNGTTMPEGFMVASGATSWTPTTPTTGPIVLADVLEGYLACPPQFRKRPGARVFYVGNDIVYGRIRGISTGVTGDSRLALGDNIADYKLWGQGTPFAIEQVGMQNNELAVVDLSQFRFYVRRGVTFKFTTAGDLMRSNLGLMVARARVGGRMVNPSAAAVCDGLAP